MGLSRKFAKDFIRFEEDKHCHLIDKGNQFQCKFSHSMI